MKISDNRQVPRLHSASVSTKSSPAYERAYGGVAGLGREPREGSGPGIWKAIEDLVFDGLAAVTSPDQQVALGQARKYLELQERSSGQIIGNIQPFELLDYCTPEIPILSNFIGSAKSVEGFFSGKLSPGETLFDISKQALGLAGKFGPVFADAAKLLYLLYLRRFHKEPPAPPLVPASPASVTTSNSSEALNAFVLGALVRSRANLPKGDSGQIIGGIPDFSIYNPQQWNAQKELRGLSYILAFSAMKTPASNVFLGTLAHPGKRDTPSPLLMRGQV